MRSWGVYYGSCIYPISVHETCIKHILCCNKSIPCFMVLGKLTKEINEWDELNKGNYAVTVYMGGIFVSVVIIIGSGILGLFKTLEMFGIILVYTIDTCINFDCRSAVYWFISLEQIDKRYRCMVRTQEWKCCNCNSYACNSCCN